MSNTSSLKTSGLIIDRSAPSVSLTGGAAYFDCAYSDSFSGVASVKHRLKSGSDAFGDWVTDTVGLSGTTRIQVTGTGACTVEVCATDYAGNAYTATKTITLDSTPPELSISGPSFSNATSVTLPVACSDAGTGISAGSLQYRTKKGTASFSAWQAVAGGAIPLSEAGQWTIEARVSDNAGNVTGKSKSLIIDRVAPVLSATGPAATNAASVAIQVTATDESSGIATGYPQYRVKKDAGAFSAWAAVPASGIALSQTGAYAIEARATDNAGNTGTASRACVIDRTNPALTITAPAATNAASVTVSISTSDIGGSGLAAASFQYRTKKDGGAFSAWNTISGTSSSFTVTETGAYTVEAKSSDVAGNTASGTSTLIIDRTLPVLSLTGPSVSAAESATVTIGASDASSGVDPAMIQYRTRRNSAAFSGWTALTGNPKSVVLTGDGNWTVEASATDRAGNRAEASKSLVIDHTGPTVSYALPVFAKSGKIALSSVNATDASQVQKVEYRIDSGAFNQLGTTYTGTFSCDVDVSTLAEGAHTVGVRATDQYGNVGTETSKAFTVDLTDPVITGITASVKDTEVGAGDYVPAGDVSIAVTASDAAPGVVGGYRYLVNQNQSADFSSVDAKDSASASFPVTVGVNGLNYVHVRAIDGAGNQAEDTLSLLVDNATPGAPTVTSATNRRARSLTDTSSETNAVFQISPTGSSGSGIAEYRWALGRGSSFEAATQVNAGTVANGGAALVTLASLADNAENEYYYFSARAVGGNGLAGNATVYQFRVDTRPPEGLQLDVSPQVNSGNAESCDWYKEEKATVSWNKPRDWTGVKSYYYRATRAESRVAPSANGTFDGWTETTDNAAVVNLKALLASDGYGKVVVDVAAVDWGGNRTYADVTIASDYVNPAMGVRATGNKVDAETVNGSASLRVLWGALADTGSGADRVSVTLSSQDRANWTQTVSLVDAEGNPLASPASSLAFDNIESGRQYTVLVTVFDRAGNSALARCGFPAALSGSLPYSETIRQVLVEGTENIGNDGSAFSNITVTLPATISLYSLSTVNGTVMKSRAESFAAGNGPDDVAAVENGYGVASVKSAVSATDAYEISLNGYTFRAKGIGFSRDYGLFLIGASYLRSSRTSGSIAPVDFEQSVSLDGLTIGFPFEIDIAGQGMGEVSAFTSRASGVDVYAVSASAGIAVGNARETLVRDAAHPLAFGDDAFERKNFALTVATDGVNPATPEWIPLRSATCLPGGIDVRAPLLVSDAKPVTLYMGGNRYALLDAELRGSLLVVNEARLALDLGDVTSVSVGGFYLDAITGEATQTGDFHCESFSATGDNGETVTLKEFALGKDGSLVSSDATITTSSGKTYTSTEVPITGGKVDWEKGAAIAEFTGYVHGFWVTSENARYTSAGLALGSAKLTYRTDSIAIEGLVLAHPLAADQTEYEVVSSGHGAASQSVSIVTDYHTVSASAFSVTPEGLFATVAVPINAGIFTVNENGNLVFANARLYADNSLSGGMDSLSMRLGSFECAATGVVFNGKNLLIETLGVTCPAGFAPGTLTLGGAAFDYAGLVSAPSAASLSSYTFGSWPASFSAVVLDANGLGGEATVTMPESLGSCTMSFPEFRIDANGVVSSGNAAAGSFVYVHDWELGLTAARFVQKDGAYLLQADAANLSMRFMGGPDLLFPGLTLASDGKIVAAANGNTPTTFVSENGYAIETSSYRIGPEYIELGGRIRPNGAWWPESSPVQFDLGGLKLLSDGSVVSVSAAPAGTYTYNDWTVTGQGVSFKYDRVSIEKNSVRFLGSVIPLGELIYASDGELLVGSLDETRTSLGIFGGKFTTVETRFDEDGLEVQAFVTLPEELGGSSIFIDRIVLHPDGTFSVEKTIDHYGFEVNGFTFDLEHLWLSTEGIKVGEAVITLPATMESKQVRVYGLSILSSGDMSLDDASVDPFGMWGMRFGLDTISIKDGIVSFGGYVGLPDVNQLGPLAGRKVALRDFKVRTSGEVISFSVVLEGEYTIPFADSWSMTVSSFGVKYENGAPWLIMREGSLIFPAGFPVTDASVSDVEFNLKEGKFYFEKATAALSGCTMNKWGMDFELTGLELVTEENDHSALKAFGLMGSVKFPADANPPFLSGASINIEQFQIGLNGSLFGEIKISAAHMNGKIAKNIDALELKDGAISFQRREDDSIVLAVAGTLGFTETAPNGLQGVELTLRGDDNAVNDIAREFGFAYDFAQGKLLVLNATASVPERNVLGVSLRDLGISIAWNSESQTGEVGISGGLTLPSTLPDGLAGQTARIDAFRIRTTGAVQEFSASFETQPDVAYDAIGKIEFKNTKLNAAYSGDDWAFSVKTAMLLPAEDFPSGVGGSSCDASMVYRLSSGLESIDARITLAPSVNLLGTLVLENGKIGFTKDASSSSLVIAVGGSIVLPPSFPAGLAGVSVGGTVAFDTTGTLRDIAMQTNSINADLFGGSCRIVNGSVSADKGTGKNEIIFTVAGGIQMISPSLPEGLRNASFVINPLRVSSTAGLLAFNAGLQSDGPIEFQLVSGITAGVKTLMISRDDFTVAAYARFPENYPTGIAGTRIDLTKLRIGWNGKIKELAGELGAANIELCGFKGSITRLGISTDGAYLESCKITMPDNFGSMGGKTVSITNAYYEKDTGKFHGNFGISPLSAEFAGFTLKFENPSLDFEKKKISFTSSMITLPAFTGGATITLNGVTLSGSGMSISGGGIKMPDFMIGSGLGFSNVYVDFAVYAQRNAAGEMFSIAGGASMNVPGVGEMTARISFTNICSDYPIGLKSAYFSFYASGPGLVLGTTPLALNGIRGGIAFGYPQPNEMPASLARYFDKGMRLQIGLRVVDVSTVGKVFTADGDVWVDVTDWDWAFALDTIVFKGTLNITASAEAALTKVGFYAGMNVEIKCVRGRVAMLIFSPDRGKSTKVAGAGQVQFGLGRGSLVDKSWKIPFTRKRIHFRIPTSDVWLPGLNTQFGDFTNGSKGFKGWIDVPLFGSVGAFVGSSGLSFNVSSLSLVSAPTASRSMASARAAEYAAKGYSRLVSVDDLRNMSVPEPNTYRFSVPGRAKPGAPTQAARSYRSMGGAGMNANGLLNEGAAGESLDPQYERVVFSLAYNGGDPDIVIKAPQSGKEFRPGDPGVETEYMEGVIAFAVTSMEVGEWTVSVDGVSSENYELTAMVKETVPEVTVLDPSYAGVKTENEFTVSGTVNRAGGTMIVYAVPDGMESGIEVGRLNIGPNGSFGGAISTVSLADGTYLVYAQYDEASDYPDVIGYAPGTISIDRSAVGLVAPGPLVGAETDPGTAQLMWGDGNGVRAAGYYLIKDNATTETTLRQYIGNIREITLYGYAANEAVTFTVVAVDDQGRESAPSNPVRVVFGAEKPVVNVPVASPGKVTVTGEIGSTVSGTIAIGFGNYSATSDASRYVEIFAAGHDDENDPLRFAVVKFPDNVEASSGTATVPWSVGLPDTLAPGTYTFECTARNMANAESASSFTITVQASYPAMRADQAEPKGWNNKNAQEITVFGNGFMPGSRVFIGGDELTISSLKYGSITALAPAGVANESALVTVEEDSALPTVVVRGPDGKEASLPVTIIKPDWSGLLNASYVETQAGRRADFSMSVTGVNDFDEYVSFTAVNPPAGWLADFERIPANGTGRLSLLVPSGTASGTYVINVSGTGGKLFPLEVRVVDAPPSPNITGMSALSGYTGETITLYGYAFGSAGRVSLAGIDCEAMEWNDSVIRFAIPDAAVSGDIVVARDGIVSNPVPFTVRDRGFSIRPASAGIDLQPGETGTVKVAVNGYADRVSLTATADQATGIVGALSRQSVQPNAIVDVAISVPATAQSGAYPLVVTGTSRGFVADATITVQVGNAFAIGEKKLPRAMVNVPYQAGLETENAAGMVTFEIAGGALPAGLGISRSGVISGKALEAGTATCAVRATDGRGRTATREFTLAVEESAWTHAGGDAGSARFRDEKSPADGRACWTAKAGAPVTGLVTSARMVWATREGENPGVVAFSRDGALRYEIYGKATWIAYVGGKLYAVREGSGLAAFEPDTGNALWERSDITFATTDGSSILCMTKEDGAVRLDAASGTMTESGVAAPEDFGKSVWREGECFGYDGKTLRGLSGGATFDAEAEILAVAADSEGFAVIDGSGALYALDGTLAEKVRARTRAEGAVAGAAKLVLAPDAIVVSDASGTREYDRQTLAERWRSARSGSIAGAKEKAFIANGSGVAAVNRYDGSVIWSDAGGFGALALSGERLYAAGSDGLVRCFNGPDNAAPPETRLVTVPSAPDGTDGWFRTLPAFSVECADRDGYVAQAFERRDDGEWTAYAGPRILDEGVYTLSAYGVDQNGWRGDTASVRYKVDSTRPESVATVEGTMGPFGWYISSALATLSASDSLSGVNRIEVDGMGTYTAPIPFDRGQNTLRYRAVDNAGNAEDWREMVILVDSTPPVVSSSVRTDRGIALVSLAAQDEMGVVDRIEYAVNGGAPLVYDKPIALTDRGIYRIQYRAYDKAGNESEWSRAEAWVSEWRRSDGYAAFASIGGRDTRALRPATPGMRLYADDGSSNGGKGRGNGRELKSGPAHLRNLPHNLIGGDAILSQRSDRGEAGKTYLNFWVKRDALAYVFSSASAAPAGWTLVETGVDIDRAAFPNGANLFMLRAEKAGEVRVPGELAIDAAPLVIVTGQPRVRVEILQVGWFAFGNPFDRQVLRLDYAFRSDWIERREDYRAEWSARVAGTEAWSAIDPSRYALPDLADGAAIELRLRLYAADGWLAAEDTDTARVLKPRRPPFPPQRGEGNRGGNGEEADTKGRKK